MITCVSSVNSDVYFLIYSILHTQITLKEITPCNGDQLEQWTVGSDGFWMLGDEYYRIAWDHQIQLINNKLVVSWSDCQWHAGQES